MKKNLYATAILLTLTSFAAAQSTGSAADSSQQQQPYGSQSSTQSNSTSSMPQSSAAPAGSQIQSSVQSALSKDTAFSGVNVSTENNQIVLSGHVATDSDKQRAEQAAQSAAGSSATVINHITVGSGSGPSMASNDSSGAWSSGQSQSSNTSSSGGMTGAAAAPSNSSTGAASDSSMSSGMSSPQSQTSTPDTNSGSNSQGLPQSSNPPSSDSSAGSMGSNASGTGTSANSGTSMSTTDDPSSQIQSAFSAQKNLAGVNVSSTSDQIVLSGTVDSKSDRDAAKKIAESYAGSRKVVDHITVGK